jgi:archaeoflavoprotein AfpA
MTARAGKAKLKKVAWGITGSGDKLGEIVDVMKGIREQYQSRVDIRVYLSKAGEQVLKWYNLYERLKEDFPKVLVEIDANSPFLAGSLQLGSFEFLLIAPATSNTVAKLSSGIADSLLSNSAVMALKGYVPVYLLPSDCKEGTILTKLPDGRDWKLRVRREDVENVEKLRCMEDVFVLEKPEEIGAVFRKHFG